MKLVKIALTPPIIAISVVLSAALGVRAAVLEVGPGKAYADIATAIGAANDHDTVLVYDGTYEVTEQLEITKPIVVRSVNGPGKTCVVRVGLDSATTSIQRCLKIDHANARVSGFAFSGGRSWYATFSGDCDDNHGAGVWIGSSGGTLADSVVSNCTLKTGWGGGVYMLAGTVTNCTVTGCRATDGSTSWSHGGGIYMTQGLVVDSTIRKNASNASHRSWGGGVDMAGGRMSRCRILDNTARAPDYGLGAGVHLSGGASLDNCLIAGNSFETGLRAGGGIGTEGSGTIVNCTIVGNVADTKGGGVLATSSAKFCNCIIQGNASLGATPDVSAVASTVFSNCVTTANLSGSEAYGTIAEDAVFTDAATGDYTLQPASPAIDAGWDAALRDMTLDLAGANRHDGPIDVGCYEYSKDVPACGFTAFAAEPLVGQPFVFTARAWARDAQSVEYAWRADAGDWGSWSEENQCEMSFETVGEHVVELRVRFDGTDVKTCSRVVSVSECDISVTTAAALVAAVSSAVDGQTIHLAAGDYEISSSLELTHRVTLVGDDGAAATHVKRVGIVSTQTTSQRCLALNHPEAVVRGITFEGGRGYSGEFEARNEDNVGGGILIGSAGGTVDGCVVTNCILKNAWGGGIGMYAGTVTNTLVTHCGSNGSSRFYGAGVWMGGGLLTHSTVRSCTLDSGYHAYGGGVSMDAGNISHCRFVGNVIARGGYGRMGGGIYASNASSVIDNCLVACNTNVINGAEGGGLSTAAALLVANCTIVRNKSQVRGGAGNSAATRFVNCILQDNETISDAASADWGGSASALFTNCVTLAALPATAVGTVPSRATLTDGFDYASVSSDGVDDGFDDVLDGRVETDLAGRPRYSGPIDAGCFEYQKKAFEYNVVVTAPRRLTGDEIVFSADAVGADDYLCSWRVDGGEWSDWSDQKALHRTFQTVGEHIAALRVKVGEAVYDDDKSGRVVISAHDLYVTSGGDIAAAIAAAGDGTTIHLAAGDYEIDRTLELSVGAVLIGEGAAVTHVKRVGIVETQTTSQRCLTLNHPEAVVRGITFEGGCGYSGEFEARNADNVGGGILIGSAGGTVDSCVVTNCILKNAWGGGIGMYAGTVTNTLVTHCGSNGSLRFYGAGVWMGGGVFTHSTVQGCTLDSGYIAQGGGVLLDGGELRYCRVEGNAITRGGDGYQFCGGVYVASATATVVGCLIAGNKDNPAGGCGGGLYLPAAACVTNCTIAGNEAKASGGGVWANGGTFVNCVFAGNLVDGVASNVTAAASAVFSNCFGPTGEMPAGEGNVFGSDAGFRNPAKGDYRLRRGTPCVDAGQNADWMEGAKDLRGERRVINGTVDIGCYEFPWNGLMLMVK